MFKVRQPIMQQQENKHALPPLSHIITAAAIPFGQHQQAPVQAPQQQSSDASDIDAQRSLISPPSSTNSPVDKKDPPSPKYSAKQPTDRCTCKHEGNHIPRPRNAFILFRQQYHQSVLDEGNVIKTNPDVSRELGKRWRDLSPQEKEYWNKLAEEEKKRHAEKYPGYRYIPRRFGNKKGSCPFCRAKASIKQQNQRSAAQNVSYAENVQAQVSPQPQQQQVQQQQQQQQHPQLQKPKGDFKSQLRTYTPTLSEEHAIAQSFLSLRNQPQPGYMGHGIEHAQHVHSRAPQPVYYQQFPAVCPPPPGHARHGHSPQSYGNLPPPPPQHPHHHQRPHTAAATTPTASTPLPGLSNYRADTTGNELPRLNIPVPGHSPSFGSEVLAATSLPTASPTDKSKACSIANFLN